MTGDTTVVTAGGDAPGIKGVGPGMLLNTLTCLGQPPLEKDPALNVEGTEPGGARPEAGSFPAGTSQPWEQGTLEPPEALQ